MNNSLGRDFGAGSLLKFTFPTIVMMLFMSLYTMVDGLFVSRFVNTTALSAVNIVYPVISVVIGIGVMLATGGSAVIAMRMGEGKEEEARKNFSLLLLTGLLTGLFLTGAGLLFSGPLLRLLGAGEGQLYRLCRDYIMWLVPFVPCSIVMMLFQTLFVTAGRPHLGLTVTILGGISNMVLDYIFIVPLQMGIAGAALATGIGYSIPALFGLLYFTFQRKGALYFVRPAFNGRFLLHSCGNGSSEMVTNLSMAVTTFLFNSRMMKFAGPDGVAAITIVLYAQYLLTAVYMGYSAGTAPVFSYQFGAGNWEQLKKLFRISMGFLAACSLLTFLLAMAFAGQIVLVFAARGSQVYELGLYGFRLFSASFLFSGFSIFASSFFTALSDGRVSAAISFLRTFVFLVLALLLLPFLLGMDGVWLAVPAAEVLGVMVSAFFLYRKRKKYHYT